MVRIGTGDVYENTPLRFAPERPDVLGLGHPVPAIPGGARRRLAVVLIPMTRRTLAPANCGWAWNPH